MTATAVDRPAARTGLRTPSDPNGAEQLAALADTIAAHGHQRLEHEAQRTATQRRLDEEKFRRGQQIADGATAADIAATHATITRLAADVDGLTTAIGIVDRKLEALQYHRNTTELQLATAAAADASSAKSRALAAVV